MYTYENIKRTILYMIYANENVKMDIVNEIFLSEDRHTRENAT